MYLLFVKYKIARRIIPTGFYDEVLGDNLHTEIRGQSLHMCRLHIVHVRRFHSVVPLAGSMKDNLYEEHM